ncbi:hypothetical protein EYR38_001973 [Pleurotus pulmonarius]|nr:hypothetical protein EYR38_001973 [Pleurotus pulmonarius]
MIEDKIVLRQLGLPTLMTDKFKPPDLSFSQVQLLKTFIEVVMKKPDSDKIKFILGGEDFTAEREVYNNWFRDRLASRINALVETAMHETGYHPQALLATQESDDFPHANLLVNTCLVQVAVEMFGDVVMSGELLIDNAIAGNFKTLLVHNVSRMSKAHLRAKAVIDKKVELMHTALKAVDEAGEEGASLASIRAAMQASKDVERLAAWYPDVQLEAEQNIARLHEAVRSALQRPKHEFDAPVRSRKPKANQKVEAARTKGRKIRISQAEMADELEVSRTLQAILTHLEHAGDMENCPTEDERHAYVKFLEEGDLGVEVMSKKTFEELAVLLSFYGGRPGNWNAYVREDGVTAWHLGLTPSNPSVTRRGPSNTEVEITLEMFARGGPGFKPISLLWHQLVGVAAIIATMFFGQRVTQAPMSGVLLADGVGVGKTAQVMATIAFLQQVQVIETVEEVRNRVGRPPLIRNMPWFMGTTNSVPNEPHLIVVPLSLVGQWADELYRFFSRGAIDIFQLPTSLAALETFFSDADGAWHLSKQKMINRIVICAHSTFQMMASEVFNMKKVRGAFIDCQRPLLSEDVNKHIFGVQWCTAWIDEAHLFRGPARGLVGACQLHQCARVTHVITATPLFTKIQDIINMGRICNHDEFSLSKGQLLERQFNREIRAAKREMKDQEPDEGQSRGVRLLYGEEVDDDDAGIAVRSAQYGAVKVVQGKFMPNLIRRTLMSVDLDGRPLNTKMPPITEHTLTFKLSDREMANLGLLVDEMESAESGVPAIFSRESFFLPYRCGIGLFKGANEDWPVFDLAGNSKLGHYDDLSSTKLDLIARIVLHLLSHDDIEHPAFVDGQVVFPDPPPVPFGQRAPRKRKILIYHEFSMMATTIATVFRMKGFGVLVLNGLLKKEERERVIQSFVHSDAPDHRVLLFSSVGAVGLNLTCADTVIMLDTIWSQVGTEQIIGRSARLTQEHAVHVYHLLALGTTDVIMARMARQKGEMLKTLLSKEKNEKLEAVFYGRANKNAAMDSEPEDDDDDSGKKKKAKGPPKTRTARGVAKNAALTSISRSVTPSTSRASKTPGVETEGDAEMVANDGGGDDAPEAGKGKPKAKARAPAKPKAAAKPRPKPKPKGRIKSAAEVIDDDAGPSEPPTGEGGVPNESSNAAGPSPPPIVGGSTPHESSNAAGPSRQPIVGGSTPNESRNIAGPSRQPVVGGSTPNESRNIAGPSRQPVVGGSTPNESRNIAGPSRQPIVEGTVPNEVDTQSPTANAPGTDARPSGKPAVTTGAMDVDAPAGQTTREHAAAASPSRQAVLLTGPGTTPVGWVATQPATQRTLPAGWIATQPATQRASPAGWIATQPATQRASPVSPSQGESMEIEDSLRRPSSPPTGTEDAPMDVDDWEEPKSRKRSGKSKRSKARRVDSAGFGPPWTQADPTTPPRPGSKHRPHSSPEKSPRTERRQGKTPRRDEGRRRVPGTDSEDDLDVTAIARIKQEGEPSSGSLVDEQGDIQRPRAPRRPAAVPDDGEDFTSLIAGLSELSEDEQEPSSDDDPLAAQRVQMSQAATAQPREHVPKVSLPPPRPPRGRGGGGRARGRK